MTAPQKRPVVVLHYLSYIHYRKSLFELLSNDDSPIEFHLLCDNVSPYGVRSFPVNEENRAKNLSVGPFIWQTGIYRKTLKKKPQAVVLLGVNPFMVSSLLYFFLLKWQGVKVLWWGHGTLGHQGRIGRVARLFFYKRADATLVYNQTGKKRLEAFGIPDEKVYSIGNCINLEDYGTERIPGLSRKLKSERGAVLKLLISGRLTKVKRIDLLLEALSLVKKEMDASFELVVIGDGPEKSRLLEKTHSLNLHERVSFVGAKYDKEVEQYFLEADFFVQPGSIGLAVFHALSYGLPVVTHNNFDSQGPEAEVLKYDGNDLLMEEGSIESLKEKINKLIQMSSKDYKELSELSFKLAKENMPQTVYENFIRAVQSTL